MSYYEDLDGFMKGMLDRTSATPEAFGKMNGEGGRLTIGPYNIPADEWEELVAEAGLPGAPWYDRNVQNAVVQHQLTRLNNKYGGRWDLTAAAWEAGEEVADRMAAGETVEQVVAGEGAQRLSAFIKEVTPETASAIADRDFSREAMTSSPFANAGTDMGGPAPQPAERTSADAAITNVLTAMRDKQIARGGGVDDDIEEGEPGQLGQRATEAP